MARILLVDDEESLADMLAQSLREEGHEVEICLEPLRAEQAALARDHDLALIDYRMPGMNGVEVLAALRASERTRRMPVLLISGTEAVRFANQIPPDPRVRFLLKPVELDVLRTLVAEMLNPESWSSKGKQPPC